MLYSLMGGANGFNPISGLIYSVIFSLALCVLVTGATKVCYSRLLGGLVLLLGIILFGLVVFVPKFD
jgi:hypothetical protein